MINNIYWTESKTLVLELKGVYLVSITEAATGGALLRKGVLRNFAKFTENYLCQILFLIKLQAGWGLQFIYKKILAGVFLRNFQEHLFTKHLWATASSIKVDDYSNCKSNFKNYRNVQIFNFIKLEHKLKHFCRSNFLTHFMPLVSFYTSPKNIRKPKVLWCFQEV